MKNDLYRPLYTEPPTLNEAGLVALLASQPEIAAAYLFGSLASGRATEHSDVDVAILLTRESDSMAGDSLVETALAGELRQFADREVDVVFLNDASLVLCHEVLVHGRLLYEGDRQARVDFEVRVGREYVDMKPVYDFFASASFAEAREGTLGKRRPGRRREAQAPTR